MKYPADSYQQTSPGQTRQERRKSGAGVLALFIAVVLWAGLVYGGFYFSRQYIDQAVQRVQQTNAMNVQTINERLDALNSETKELKEVLGYADETLTSTGDLQKELTDKIKMLEKQMQELEKSLNVLKEAPNGSR